MTDALYNFMEYFYAFECVSENVMFLCLHCLFLATNTDTTVCICSSSNLKH